MENNKFIAIEIESKLSADFLWKVWTQEEHIVNWNHASEEWHTTKAEVDLRVGGRFSSRMEAKDGSMGFDFGGTYTKIEINELLEFTLDDDRKVKVKFEVKNGTTHVKELFEPESTHSREMQKSGWQAILDNFKKYAESL